MNLMYNRSSVNVCATEQNSAENWLSIEGIEWRQRNVIILTKYFL